VQSPVPVLFDESVQELQSVAQTTAEPSREDVFIDPFLSTYEDGVWSGAQLTKPDAIDRTKPAVDKLAVRNDGKTLAIEHTIIEPFAARTDRPGCAGTRYRWARNRGGRLGIANGEIEGTFARPSGGPRHGWESTAWKVSLGCGRGAVLTAVARRLAVGRVTGVDIWSKKDQSGNAKDVALHNASLEGVSDRVHIETGDMRALPYPNATFDLVVSSLAIHNIRSNADRKRAIIEGFRVLKPGGGIVIADIRATAIYEDALRELGALHVERRRLGGDSGGAIQSPAQPSSPLQGLLPDRYRPVLGPLNAFRPAGRVTLIS
jgi:SAM-dependent methyltransferase